MTKIRPTAFHVGPPIADALDGWDHSRSARLNGVVARYLELIEDEQARLTFTLDEWSDIIAALRGAEVEGRDAGDWHNGWAALVTRDGSAFQRALGLRIQQMSDTAQCAIWELAACYWTGEQMPIADFLAERKITPRMAVTSDAAAVAGALL